MNPRSAVTFQSLQLLDEFIMEVLVDHTLDCPIPWPINKQSSHPNDYDGYYMEQAYRHYAQIQNIPLEFDWDDDLIIPIEFKTVWKELRSKWSTDVYQAALIRVKNRS
jgi:hypothetical protein